MRINGVWQRQAADSETAYPIVEARVRIGIVEYPISLLVDTGADRTVLGSNFASLLAPYYQEEATAYLSAGGNIDAKGANVELRFATNTGRIITFRTSCLVLQNPNHLNTHLLGRDVLDYFALICDRSTATVALLRPPHTYHISE